MYLRAKWILPISGPPIEDGWVEIQGDRIARIGQGKPPKGAHEALASKGKLGLLAQQSQRLCEVQSPVDILLPGLVNAHSHLELGLLNGADLKRETFTGWVREILKARDEISPEEYTQGVRAGIMQLLLSGVTCVADHVANVATLPALVRSSLKGRIFLEISGLDRNHAQESLAAFRAAISDLINAGTQEGGVDGREPLRSLRRGGDGTHRRQDPLGGIYETNCKRFRVSLTPHAPQSVHPDVLGEILGSNHSNLFSLHLAESREEDRLYKMGRGPMADLVLERGGNVSTLCRSGIRALDQHGYLSDKVMAIHCNYIDDEDIALLANHRVSVVHCPGSHGYFSHRRFRLESLTQAGINIALGTDSIASNQGLNMLKELKRVRVGYPELTPSEILKMATVGGAIALKMECDIGTLDVGKRADLIGISLKEPTSRPEEAVLEAESVAFSMIDGRVVVS